MRGVGPGTVLGGRYAVHRRLEQRRDTERWSADDTTLGRRVSVLVIGADDGRTPDLLDAARRAASVTHTVFVRILDVGSDAEVSYVVEEDLSEARSLTDLVTDGGVPGDEVRRITGEVAAALETARQRGMHHLELEPDDVLRTPEGDIRLRGLETAAVRAGHEGAEPEDAARRDAVGVVALAYAGLTGLWPLGAGGSGLGAAPRVPGGVAAPSEIAAGVPRDLDAICRLTINDDQGPTSPGDFARQVAPWPSRQVVGRPVVPAVTPPRPDTLDDPVDDEPTRAFDVPADDEPVPDAVDEVDEPKAVVGSDVETDDVADAGRPNEADEATHELPRVVVPEHGGTDDTVPEDVPEDDLGHEATRVIALPTAPPSGAGDEPDPDAPAHDEADPADDADGARRGPTGAAGGAAAAGAAAVAALGSVGGRVSNLARAAVDKVAELSPDTTSAPREPREPREARAPRPSRATRDRGGAGELEAPAPLVPSEPLTKDESKLALGIVAGFLVLALVIGIWGVSRIGANTDLELGGPAASSTRTSAAPTSAAPSDSGSPAPSGDPEPLAILKVEAYDPEGDGEENNQLTPKTYDGDTGDGWFSENYRSNEFGGLKKGLGVVVDLGPNKKPQGVELTVPVAADLEVYVGPDNRLEGATKVGEKKDAQGKVTFQVPADVSGQYIVVWYTKLTPDDREKRRAWLNEVVVTG
ncbi:hypothetical protein [Oryzobacter terrae]|uniref:hypothetical protein n=1 Tax=Oryzobacter terrae TaxID=1620385 RepID=UPI00366E03ED